MIYILEKIFNFKVNDCKEDEIVSLRIGNLLSFLGFFISNIYGLIYLIYVESFFTFFLTQVFAFSYLIYFYLIYKNEFIKARLSFFVVVLLQFLVITIFFLSTKSGIHYYYFLVPPVAYLMFRKEMKLRFIISAISFLLLVLCHFYGQNYHILDLDENILDIIYIISIIIIFLVYIVLFNTFLDEIRKREVKLEALSKTDYLTKILNRRAFYTKSNEMIKLSERYETDLGLLLFDIDHFKMINDKYGHDAGDSVLVSLCKELSKSIRDTDCFARFGGEEFIIVLLNVSKEELLSFAEKIREIVEDMKIKSIKSEDINFTISIGATIFKKEENIESFIKRADIAMYKAKTEGRNIVRSEFMKNSH